jgi:Tol biopolymer transport system component
VHQASDGFNVGIAEIGNGSAIDFFQSEFLGISWSPDGTVFASPAYVNVVTNTGRQTVAAGIVLFGFDPATLTYTRVGQMTTPQVIDTLAPGIIIETHAFPVFSPDGQRLAFFSITYPDPLLVGPATAELLTINANGTNRTSLLQFNPGFYPVGLSWTPDGNQLVFSIAEQVQSGGLHSPLPVPSTAVLRLVSASGGMPSPIAEVPAGFFPSVVPVQER